VVTQTQILNASNTGRLASRREDCSLPPGIKGQRWAQAQRWRRHAKGPVLVLYRIYPLNLYCAGWIPFAGQLCIPSIVGGFEELDSNLVETRLDLLMEEEFAIGPTPDLIARSEKIAKEYAENGRKGGRPKRVSTDSVKPVSKQPENPDWRKQFPGWSFGAGSDETKVHLCGPDPQLGGTYSMSISKLCDDWEGKDIHWWKQHGPTDAMMRKHQEILSRPLEKAAKKEN